MSIATDGKPATIAQRTTEATHQVAALLGLDDVKRLSAALAEAAAEGVRKNPSFAAHVRNLYEEMAPKPKAAARRPAGGKRAAPDIELIPIKHIDGVLNRAAPPDPYFLIELYGAHQLRRALERYTLPRLRESIKIVQAKGISGKPQGAARDAVIDYIVEQVAGPGY